MSSRKQAGWRKAGNVFWHAPAAWECDVCGHRFDGKPRHHWRGRRKVLYLDIPCNGGYHAVPPYVCQWCGYRLAELGTMEGLAPLAAWLAATGR